VGFVVVVNDLRGLMDRVQDSPFAKKYLSTARGQAAMASPEWNQLAEVSRLFKSEIGADWPELRDGVLGDAVVFIYLPGPPEQPEKEESLVLIHARDPKLVERIYAHIDAAQAKSGQLKEKVSRQHGGRGYTKRVRTDEEDEYSYINGPFTAFGNSERLLQAVIDRDLQPAPSRVGAEIDRLGLSSASFLWWVNPRAFDAMMAFQQKKETGPAAFALAAIQAHWQALDGIALSYHLQSGSELRLSFVARPEALPASTRTFLTELASPSILSAIFPKDALMTLTGRVSLPAVLNFGAEFLPTEGRQQLSEVVQKSIGAVLGDSVLAALPKNLGPDWGVCVTAPTDESKARWPIALAAVKLNDPPDGTPVVSRVVDGINALATLAVVGFNSKNTFAVSLHNERIDGVEVRSIVPPKDLADDVRPSFAWKDGYLLMASHPEGIRQFTGRAASVSGNKIEARLLQVNLPAWAKYLRQNRALATTLLSKQEGMTSEKANQQFDAALEVLDLFQSIGLTIDTAPGRAVVSFQINPVESFVRPEK
jgi:hypothetical protein